MIDSDRTFRTDRSIEVGFIGLGNMGWPMAGHLITAGFPLTVRDADSERERRFAAEHGCAVADSPQAFSSCAVIVTILPDDKIVRQAVLEWQGGLGPALSPGTVVVEMSSSNPTATVELGRELAKDGVDVVDAPVSGGVQRAKSATLTIMIGGDDTAVERAEAVLETLGERLFRTGPLGTGHAMKALNNFVGGATYAIVTEALAIGQHFGLTPETMIDVMNASTARSFNTEFVLKEHVLTGEYATGFALGLLAKDVGIAGALAAAAGVDAPFSDLTNRRWGEAASNMGPSPDHSRAHQHWWPNVFAVTRKEADAADATRPAEGR
jgi:3-hydroxyisobutyrate dehydrogenase